MYVTNTIGLVEVYRQKTQTLNQQKVRILAARMHLV